MAKTSKPQLLAAAKYRQENCDQLAVDIPKGKKALYKQAAAEMGLSLTALIQNGVEGFVNERCEGFFQRENFSPITQNVASTEKLSANEKRLVEEFNQLPVETQKALLKLVKTINEQSKGGVQNGNE